MAGGSTTTARSVARTLPLDGPLDLRATLGPLQHGRGDRSTVVSSRHVWRATVTPDGATTLHLEHWGDRLEVRAWGPGREWAVEHAPDLVGSNDVPAALDEILARLATPERSKLLRLHRAHPGLRVPRCGAVVEALTPAILGQRVTGLEAVRSYRSLQRALGRPAPHSPGDLALRLPPPSSALAELPSWEYHRHGVERQRADTIVRVNRVASSLDRVASLPVGEAHRVLRSVAGVGPWTAAEVAATSLGDPDAVPVGDFHLKNVVAWSFRGRARGTDDEMLELLAPYAGQRGRVIRLLMLSRAKAPARGPRRRNPDIRRL